jgi:hypothetical protein
MKILAPAIVTLSLCLAGCGGGTGNNAAAAGEKAAPSDAANAAAPSNAANAATPNATPNAAANAATPAGPCPFEIRNVRALRSGIPDLPGSGAAIFVTVRPDAQGRPPQISQRTSPAPDLLLDIDPDPAAPASADREAGESGIGGFPATPDYTHAIVRCRGVQVARVPIRP